MRTYLVDLKPLLRMLFH